MYVVRDGNTLCAKDKKKKNIDVDIINTDKTLLYISYNVEYYMYLIKKKFIVNQMCFWKRE